MSDNKSESSPLAAMYTLALVFIAVGTFLNNGGVVGVLMVLGIGLFVASFVRLVREENM